MKEFIAIFRDEGRAYYAKFHFEVERRDDGSGTVSAYNDWVRTWPEHEQLEEHAGHELLDDNLAQWMPAVEAFISRELKK